MKEVVSTSAVFFSYALLAIFAQNAVFTRALGVSRMVQLVGDDRTSSALFGMMLCITQVLVAPVAFLAGHCPAGGAEYAGAAVPMHGRRPLRRSSEPCHRGLGTDLYRPCTGQLRGGVSGGK